MYTHDCDDCGAVGTEPCVPGCPNLDSVAEYTDEPVTIEERRAMGDDMLYPTYDIFGNWEN